GGRAVAGGFGQPRVVVGREPQRRRARPQGKPPEVLADVVAERAHRVRGLRRDAGLAQRQRREAEVEDPVEEAQLEGAVVPDAVTAAVVQGVHGTKGFERRGSAVGERVLRTGGVLRPHWSYPA